MNPSPHLPRAGGKHNRPCPALNNVISPADCGAQRGSKLKCPPECGYFPFGTRSYALCLNLDVAWLSKASDRVVAQMGLPAFERLLRQQTVPMGDTALSLHCAIHHAVHLRLFLQRDEQGKTLADYWEARGWEGLNNDERVMTQHRRASLPTVVEVRKILDERSAACVDLLTPDAPPFVLYDSGVAAGCGRFDCIFTWLVQYPHYARSGGVAVRLHREVWPAWFEEISRRHRAAAASRPDLTLKQYLAETVVESAQLIPQLKAEQQQQALAQLDLYRCHATYRVTGPLEEIEAILATKPGLRPARITEEDQELGTQALYDWAGLGDTAELTTTPAETPHNEPADEFSLVARLRVTNQSVHLSTISRKTYSLARQLLEQYLGSRISFQDESQVALAELYERRQEQEYLLNQAAAHAYRAEVAPQAAAAPRGKSGGQTPSSEAQRPSVQEAQRDYYRVFLERPSAALEGRSPRAASADATLRPKLVEMMKGHVGYLDRQDREHGWSGSADWVLEELGLSELR